MGRLEEGILASLARLREADPGGGEPMFVLPSSLMTVGAAFDGDGVRTLRDGEVTMVLRVPPETEG